MHMALLSNNRFMFIDEDTHIPPRTDPLYPIWERCNNLVLSWIIKSLSPSIAQSVLCSTLLKTCREFLKPDLLREIIFGFRIYKSK